MNQRSILIVDDEAEVLDYLESALLCHGYAVTSARDGSEALSVLQEEGESIGLVVLDLMMPRKDGIETLCDIRKSSLELPVIALSGTSDPSRIVQAIKAGANDVLEKPVVHKKLIRIVEKNLVNGNGHGLVSKNGKKNDTRELYHSSQLKRIGNYLDKLSAWNVPVVFRGETGVGKEVLVRDLHKRSPRASKPFVKINCVALPSELLESELFGYEKGAFTGAFQGKAGKFEIANGGTVFLDEIGDMDLKLQAKLLQVLQDGEFYRLGGKEPVTVDVRVVTATHRDLESAIREGSFREDLYHRLNVVSVRVPPLRERREEIVPFAEHFLVKHNRPDNDIPQIPLSLRGALIAYRWPGNVRELENLMRKFLVFRDADELCDELRRRSSGDRSREGSAAEAVGWKGAGYAPAVDHQNDGRAPSPRFGSAGSNGTEQAPGDGDVSSAWDAVTPLADRLVQSNGPGSSEAAVNSGARGAGSSGQMVSSGASFEGTIKARTEAASLTEPPAEFRDTNGRADPIPENLQTEDAAGGDDPVSVASRQSYPSSSYGAVLGGAQKQEGQLLTIAELDEAQRTAEKKVILAALGRTNWNRKKAARTLGIDYKALLYKMKKLGI